MNESADRSPPWSLEAEVAVLGAMLVDRDAIPLALEYAVEEAFYREAHRRLFRAMVSLWSAGEVVDVVTVAERLKDTSELDAAGGLNYLGELVSAVPTTANIEWHAKIVRDKYRLRRLIEACTLTIRDVYDVGERSVDEVVTLGEERVLDVGASDHGRGYVRAKELIWPTFEEIERRQGSPGSTVGIPTGIRSLDRMTLGLHPGEVTVIAARPSMGKTALAMQIAAHAATGPRSEAETLEGFEKGVPTLVFSFEMTAEELMLRNIASEAKVDLQAVRGGRKLKQEEHQRLAVAAGVVNTAHLYIEDSPESEVGAVVGRAMRIAHAEDIGLIVIDYLQLMEGTGRDRQAEITMISRRLKRLAHHLHVPVVLLSQLSRGPEQRPNKRPILSDLRESGAIEQDADGVWMLFRPEYYMDATDIAKAVGKNKDPRGVAEILIMKQRNGPTGTVKTHFEKSWTRFADRAPEQKEVVGSDSIQKPWETGS